MVEKGDISDLFEVRIEDPYRWLEELESEDTRRFIAAQNAYATPRLEALPLVAHFEGQLDRLSAGDVPAIPRWSNGRWIQRIYRNSTLQRLIARTDLEQEPRVLVTSSQLEPDHPGAIRWLAVSPDGTTLAYARVVEGGDLQAIRFWDLERGRHLRDRLEGIKFSNPVWMPDSSGLLYGYLRRPGNFEADGIDRGAVLAYHRLGEPQELDRVLMPTQEPAGDGDFFGVTLDESGRYAYVTWLVASAYQQRTFLLTLGASPDSGPSFEVADIGTEPVSVGARRFVGVHGERVYLVVQDEKDPGGRVEAIPVEALEDPGRATTIIAGSEHVITAAAMAKDHLLVQSRADVESVLQVYDLDGQAIQQIPLPAPGSVFGLSVSRERPEVHFGFDAYAFPAVVLQHDLDTGATIQVDERRIGFDRSAYSSRRVFAESADGTRIPVFITHRSDIELPAPTLLNAYGAGGVLFEPIFQADFGAWMASGGVIAVANVRGGGAYGVDWAAQGALEGRHRTHDDLIASAELLFELGVTERQQLGVYGESAGGMLVSAVMAQRPKLFQVVLPRVPVTDLVSFARFTAGARLKTVVGDPERPDQLADLLRWSPLQNIRDGVCYPATLIQTAVDDDLVHPSQAYKFAARLQAAQGCDRDVLLSVSAEGGHYGSTDPEKARLEIAQRLAFLAAHTGLIDPR